MRITVKLFATFRNGRFKGELREYPPGTEAGAVASHLGIAPAELGILLVNGRHAPLDHTLQDGDALALFPLVGGG